MYCVTVIIIIFVFIQQTDRSSSSKASKKVHVPLTELESEDCPEEDVNEETVAVVPTISSQRPPVVVPPRTHLDSVREITELEPIDEHGERLESTSIKSASIEETVEDK